VSSSELGAASDGRVSDLTSSNTFSHRHDLEVAAAIAFSILFPSFREQSFFVRASSKGGCKALATMPERGCRDGLLVWASLARERLRPDNHAKRPYHCNRKMREKADTRNAFFLGF
jgi:hypothetical protein